MACTISTSPSGRRWSTLEVFRFRTLPRTSYPCSSSSRMQNPAAYPVAPVTSTLPFPIGGKIAMNAHLHKVILADGGEDRLGLADEGGVDHLAVDLDRAPVLGGTLLVALFGGGQDAPRPGDLLLVGAEGGANDRDMAR